MNIKKDYKIEKIINKDDFNNFLFLDIETYQYNELEGYRKPSSFKNMIFSLAVSVFYEDTIYCNMYYNFYYFLKLIKKKDTEFKFYIHNGYKYDIHFLLWELKYYYKLPVYNLMLDNENGECKSVSNNLSDFKHDVILQKRVKSKNNLDMIFTLNSNTYKFEDTYLKTNLSLRTLAIKLNKLHLLDESELKTDFNYTEYNLSKDLTDIDAKTYAKQIFFNLNNEQKTYIYNDVIILCKVYIYFNQLFPHFDIDKMTLSQNILDSYLINDLTRFQMLQKIDNYHNINNTDYSFNGTSLYYYLKKAYKGGLNFYNDNYIDIILDIDGFSIDINSSYPFIMYNDKIPTFLVSYGYEKKLYYNTILNDNYYYVFEISKEYFNRILSNTLSKNVTKMLVKYYFSKDDSVYLNSNTLKIFNEIFNMNIKSIYVKSFLKYECFSFGGRELINEYYFIKQQGKSKKKLNYINANNITFTKFDNDDIFTDEEISNAKVKMNGAYGVPALRPYFNNFKLINDELVNFENGFKNSERNIIFSIYITSKALFNLLYPLKFLTTDEIDKYLLYTDTDSLYFSKKSLIKKIPTHLINDLNLGAFSYDCKDITKFYILNHKKYAYYNNEKKKIVIKCGGVPLDSFHIDKYNDFDTFIKNEFYYGKEVKNQKSILNKMGTISIYQSTTHLDKGEDYPVFALNHDLSFLDNLKKDVENKIISDIEYIETNIGAFSFNDLNVEVKKNTTDLKMLLRKQWIIRKKIGV